MKGLIFFLVLLSVTAAVVGVYLVQEQSLYPRIAVRGVATIAIVSYLLFRSGKLCGLFRPRDDMALLEITTPRRFRPGNPLAFFRCSVPDEKPIKFQTYY